MHGVVRLTFVCGAAVAALVDAAHAGPPAGAKVYVSASDGASVSVVSAVTRSDVVSPFAVGIDPRWVVPRPDGSFVYVANAQGATGPQVVAKASAPRAAPGSLPQGTPSVSVIDTSVDAVVDEIELNRVGATGLALTPNAARLYVTCPASNAVCVVDTESRTQVATVDTGFQTPEAIVASRDGTRMYVLNRGNSTVSVLLVATNSLDGEPIPVGDGHRDLGISANGGRLLLVGDGPTEVLDVTTRAIVATLGDVGSHRHVAVAGNLAAVSNQNHTGTDLPPGSSIEPGQGALDLYDISTATYLAAIPLSAGNPYGVAIAPDGTYAWVTSKNSDVLMSVDLVAREEDGATAPIGPTSRNAAVVVPSETTVVSYFLPTVVNLKLAGAGKDSLATGGLFDDGNLPADYSRPVTLEVGSFSRTFTLVANANRTAYTFRDAEIQLTITPNLRGSSRGRFKLKIRKTTLQGLVAADGPVEIHFRATGLPDMAGTVVLEKGRYRRARTRGALIDPPFFAGLGQFTLKGDRLDSCVVRWGFSAGQSTPASLADVRIGIGALDLVVPGTSFTKSARPGEESFLATYVDGATKVTISLDFKRELVRVVAKNVELGDLRAGGGTDFVLDPGIGASVLRNRVRLGGAGGKVFY